MNVFVDTSIVNRLLDLEEYRENDPNWQEVVKYLKLLLDGPVAGGSVALYVNPSVKREIENTKVECRKTRLLSTFHQLHFTEFNLTIFPFNFPARFISDEQEQYVRDLCTQHPALSRDQKVIADAAFSNSMDYLLTADRNLAHQVGQVGKVKFVLPKELYERLTKSNA